MKISQRYATLALASMAGLFSTGCDQGRPAVETSMTPATVTGVVKCEGKPVAEGTIYFNPSNAERKAATASAKLGPDGSYSVETLIGGSEVRFAGPFIDKRPNSSLLRRFAELKRGTNEVDFDLFGPGDVPRGVTPPRGAGVASN